MKKTVAGMFSTCADEVMDISISSEGNKSNSVSDEFRNYLTITLTVALVVWYAQFLWKRRYLYIHSWNVQGPLAFPIIGCGYLVLGNKNGVVGAIMEVLENFDSGLFRIWAGTRLIYIVSEPEQIEKILNHPKALNKEDVYKFVGNAFGFGLLTAPVEKWKEHRKLLAPAFNQKLLDTFVDIFAEQSIVFADELKNVVGRTDFDLYLLATRCTLDTVCQTTMGVNMNTQKEKSSYGTVLDTCVLTVEFESCHKNCTYYTIDFRVMEIVMYRIFKLWYHLDIVWYFSSSRKVAEIHKKILQDVTSSVVSKKLAEHKKNMTVKNSYIVAETDEEPTHKHLAVLDLILQKSVFTEAEMAEEINIFLAAGTETSASSICFLSIMLGMHPEVQQNVYEEVMDILGPDRSVVASDLPKMKYTERVIKENLRLFPVAFAFGRSLTEDIDLGNVILPAGSSAAFCTFQIHRNPKYWPDPLKFDPDRFLSEEVAKRHPCTYIPFSYGPRNCIGWKYAIANLKCVIATVIRQYKIFTLYKSVEEIELKINLLLRTKNGPKVWIEYR